MGTLATILGGAGAILLLVGLVGGGFEFSGSVMPKVGKVSRILCFAFGGLLLLTSLGLVASAAAETPAQVDTAPTGGEADTTAVDDPEPSLEPATGHVMVGSGYTAFVFAEPHSDAALIAEIPDGTVVHIICTTMGEAVTSPVIGVTSSLWNFTTDGGFIPDALINTGTDQPTMPNCST